MEVNYLAVLTCAVISMILGGIWYGPLFGKKWMEILGTDSKDKKEIAKMQKSAGPLYLIQFLLTLFQAYVLAYYVKGWNEVSGVEGSLWIFFAFIMPTIAGFSMWNNYTKKVAIERFLIQSGYQLVLFTLFGLILGSWK